MFSKSILNKFIEIAIKTWLKSICKSINILSIKLIRDKNSFGKIDEIYFKAMNIIYQDLYIYKIIIKGRDCSLKFNYKNHLIYSEDLIINCFLSIDSKSLENTFFSNEWKNFRIKIEKDLLAGGNVSNLVMNNGLITCSYNINKLNKHLDLVLDSKENLILIEDIKNKKMISLPLDKNIKFNSCNIKDELININLISKVIFDN